MALWMVLPESEHWIEVAERGREVERATGEVAPQAIAASADAPAAERALWADYSRPSRLAWGLLAQVLWLCACIAAALIPTGFTETLEREQVSAWGVTVAGVVFAVGLGLPALRLLLRLRRAGRPLTRALSYWVRLPYRAGSTPRTMAQGYLTSRQVLGRFALSLRFGFTGATGGTGALAILFAVKAWTDSQPGMFLLMVLLAPVALATTVCMSGGAWRVFLAYSESDPAWVAIRRFFSFGRTRTPRPVTPAQNPENSGVA